MKKTKFSPSASTPISLSNEGLPSGWGPWDLPAGWKLAPQGGPGGVPALVHTRTDSKEYLNARLPMRLKPGSRFKVTAAIQVDPNPKAQTVGCATVEFFDSENRFLGGGALPAVQTPSKWITGSSEFTVPEYTSESRLMFYLRAGVTGTARFAAPVIEPASFRWTAFPLTTVRDELPQKGGEIPFGFFSQGRDARVSAKVLRCRVELLVKAKSVASTIVQIAKDRFTAKFKPLPAGPATLRFTLLGKQGRAVGEKTLPVTVVDEKTLKDRAARGCTMDSRGRIRIKNRPFLPIGLYMGMVERDEIADIRNSPFNCLLPYGSPFLKFKESKHEGADGVREVLDALHKHGMKLIFCLSGAYDEPGAPVQEYLGVKGGTEVARKVAMEFRDHPALLAWYINDEQPIENLPRIMDRRRLMRSIDPLHPIYAVMCQVPEFPLYSEVVDVYGIDPYPIVDPVMNHIRASGYAHDMAEKALRAKEGLALWTVVQAHNIGAYDPKAKVDPVFYRENYRDPTFDEMLALSLLAAIRGARGFLFYSYPDLANPEFDQAAREGRWANTKRAAQVLRDLEPFLLSDADEPKIGLKVLAGQAEARAFRDDDGRLAILIVGIGPGPCRAELKIGGSAKLVSKFNRTKLGTRGAYRFEGRDVCADVLVEASD